MFFIYSLFGIAAGFLLHAPLYFGLNTRSAYPTAWLLMHLSMVVSWAAVFVAYRLSRGTVEVKPDERAAPALVMLTLLFVLCAPYAVFNFIHTHELLRGGSLGIVDGENVVLVKGRVAMRLSPDEVPRYELYEARRVSGHWMLAHLIPGFFLYMYVKWNTFE